MIEVARMRDEYENVGIDVDSLDPDPIVQFRQWLEVAVEVGITEANAMVVSTVDTHGQPWSRFVLLKDVDDRGFTFYTNYDSHKSIDLAAQPRAALTFGWLELRRQVNIAGTVERVSATESDRYWAIRPRGSQLGSAASRQSQEVADRSVIDRWYAETEQRYEGGAVPRPVNWGGWRVVPHTIEFWQGRLNRLHDRIRYRRLDGESEAEARSIDGTGRRTPADGGWERVRLSP